jgi:exosome complex component CSL4
MSFAALVPGTPVICRIDRVYAQKAEVTLIAHELSNGSTEVLKYPAKGFIRIQDVRSFDIDKASMMDHFFPSDFVRAQLISVGDMKSCYLSTIGQDFGVIQALDPQGNKLYPVDQSHMKNDTGAVFKRKVARPSWFTL